MQSILSCALNSTKDVGEWNVFVFFAAETVETLNLKKKNKTKREQLSAIFISFKSRIYDFREKNEFGGK